MSSAPSSSGDMIAIVFNRQPIDSKVQKKLQEAYDNHLTKIKSKGKKDQSDSL
jgi:hypothetical protein